MITQGGGAPPSAGAVAGVDGGDVLVLVLGVASSWARLELGRPWRAEAAVLERTRGALAAENRRLSEAVAAAALAAVEVERERNELRDKLSKQTGDVLKAKARVTSLERINRFLSAGGKPGVAPRAHPPKLVAAEAVAAEAAAAEAAAKAEVAEPAPPLASSASLLEQTLASHAASDARIISQAAGRTASHAASTHADAEAARVAQLQRENEELRLAVDQVRRSLEIASDCF